MQLCYIVSAPRPGDACAIAIARDNWIFLHPRPCLLREYLLAILLEEENVLSENSSSRMKSFSRRLELVELFSVQVSLRTVHTK